MRLLNCALLAVPLTQPDDWRFLQYRHVRSNEYRCSPVGLEITVQSSASPAVFPLKTSVRVQAIRVSGKIAGTLRVPEGRQGTRQFDDYTLRIGLVEAGPRRLSFYEQMVAPDWVRTLFNLAPKKTGISTIHFFNLGTQMAQIGRERDHPASPFIREQTVAMPQADGRFAFIHQLDQSIETLAVWIGSDGDDTQSEFKVTLEKLELKLAPRSE